MKVLCVFALFYEGETLMYFLLTIFEVSLQFLMYVALLIAGGYRPAEDDLLADWSSGL